MKIFFDGKIFSSQKAGGISRLNFELIKNLSQKKEVDAIFYHGLHVDNYPFKKEWFKKEYGFKKQLFAGWRLMNFLDNLWMNAVYQWHATPDMVFHSLYYRIPKNPKGPVVVHAYDMIQELFATQEGEPRHWRGGNQKTIQFKKRAFDRADVIIAISESTKHDICKLYAINPDKIIIAYPGVSDIFFNSFANIALKRPYMLYVGARNYQYKNFDIVLNTFIEKKYYADFDLVVFGGEKLDQKQLWLRQESGNDEALATLYAGASLFIYPSLYEGFGIPPLEAMAAGCPVIASNASSVPEVVGDAGLLFDPKNPSDLAQKIEMILRNKDLAASLIQKGKVRARQFTWSAMAEKIYEAYSRLLKSKDL